MILPVLGVAGALAFIASAQRRRVRRAPDAAGCAWEIPAPIPVNVVQRALELLARGDPLGTEYVEELEGTIYKFRREMHGPNPEIDHWHPGVGVRACARPRRALR